MFGTKGIKSRSLTYKNILEDVSEYDLWCHYLNTKIVIGKKILSPVREEKDPSAVFFVTPEGHLILKDFNGENWNLLKYLKYVYGLTYKGVLEKIDSDFKLGYLKANFENTKRPKITKFIPKHEPKTIWTSRKKFDKDELAYWAQYGITKKTLEKYNVYPLECFWLVKNNQAHNYCRQNSPIFCYDFGNQLYKIYRPLNTNYRWFTNAPYTILQGYDQLDWLGDLLIITKSLKDVMLLRELGYNAIALQSENVYLEHEDFTKLAKRFKKIYLFFDNDKAGIEAAKKLSSIYKIPMITIKDKPKDISDYCKLYGFSKTEQDFKQWLVEIEQQGIIGKEK